MTTAQPLQQGRPNGATAQHRVGETNRVHAVRIRLGDTQDVVRIAEAGRPREIHVPTALEIMRAREIFEWIIHR